CKKKESLVGLADPPAPCVVAGGGGGVPLERHRAARPAPKRRPGHGPPLFPALDGTLRPVRFSLHASVLGGGDGPLQQPEEPPPWCGTRLRPMGRCVSDRQAVPG